MSKTTLPSLRGAAAWSAAPPDPLDDPDLYDGIIGRRSVAYLLDVAFIAVLMLGFWVVLSLLAVLSFGLLLPFKLFVLALLPLAYHTYFVGRSGATPGMRLFDVELRCWTGESPDYVRAGLQTILFYASVAMTTWLILIVAFFNDRHRTLHDYLAGTVAVRHSRLAPNEAGTAPVRRQ